MTAGTFSSPPNHPRTQNRCITRLLSFPKSRQALFDFAIAGPAAASALGFAAFVAGLGFSMNLPAPDPTALITAATVRNAPQTTTATTTTTANMMPLVALRRIHDTAFLIWQVPVVPSGLLSSSLLLGSTAKLFLPALSTQPVVPLHPIGVVGFVTCLLNALQLLPIGRCGEPSQVMTTVLTSCLTSAYFRLTPIRLTAVGPPCLTPPTHTKLRGSSYLRRRNVGTHGHELYSLFHSAGWTGAGWRAPPSALRRRH